MRKNTVTKYIYTQKDTIVNKLDIFFKNYKQNAFRLSVTGHVHLF